MKLLRTHRTKASTMPENRHIMRSVWAVLLSIFIMGGLYAAALSKSPAPLAPDTLSAANLTPLPEHTVAHKEIMQHLQREHLRAVACDDALAAKLLDNYLEDLDPARSFLLQSDIDDFTVYRTTLDEALLSADLGPAFGIFNRFQQRRLLRLEAIILRLGAGIGDMDFTLDEVVDTERTDAAWGVDITELDRLWEKRLKLGVLNLLLAGKEPQEARELLIKRFRNQVRLMQQINSEDVFQLYMNSLTGCYDPHTQYFSPRTSENFNISMRLSLEGIGAVLTSDDEYTKVIRLLPGGPADKSKLLKPADRIVGVGQGPDGEMQDVVGWRLDDVVDLIRGPKGSVVRLDVLPAGVEDLHKTKKISIERSTVKLEDQAARKRVLTVEREGHPYRIGIIELPTFYRDFQALLADDPTYKSTAKDVERLLRECAADNIDGLILDLRDNGGGSLQEAVDLTGKFIRYGPVVQVRASHKPIEVQSDSDHRTSYNGPLLVMVNRLSASASEIVAGAMQDYGRAIVFGSQTFGKGTVQSLIPLAHGQLKETLAAYYRVTGEGTQYRGIIPDITYPCLYDPAETGESALPDALPWDTIDRIWFPHYSDIGPLKSRLHQLHDRRMLNDPDYHYLMELSEHLRALSSRTRISLSRAQREREQAEDERFRLSLENRLRAAKNLPLFATYADLEQEQPTDNATDPPDPMLDEAAAVLIDCIGLQKQARHTEGPVSLQGPGPAPELRHPAAALQAILPGRPDCAFR